MKILMLGTDSSLLEGKGDSFNRVIDYGKMVSSLDVIVFSHKKDNGKMSSHGNVRFFPTNSSSKLLAMYDALALGFKNKNEQYDFVVSQDPFRTGLVAAILSRLLKTKLLISVYGTNIFDTHWKNAKLVNRFIYYSIGRWVLSQADAVQTDGFETVEDLGSRIDAKVFWKPMVPHNILDFKAESNAEREDGPVKLLFVGRFVTQKNLMMLLSATKSLKDKGLSFSLVMVGDGPLRNQVLNEAKRMGVYDYIEYRGLLGREDVVKTFLECDIFVMTSYFEGFPRVFMEAAATGLPIVTTLVSGVSNVIEDNKSGFIVPQEDEVDFVNKLSMLIEDSEMRKEFGERIKEDFWSRYSYDVTLEKQKEVFEYLASL